MKHEVLKYDVVLVKELWKYPVITNHELKLLLDLLEDYHPYKIALLFIAIEGMRPKEACQVLRKQIILDENGDPKEIIHYVYKPKNRIGSKGERRIMYKKVRKPIFSNYLKEQLKGYLLYYPPYEFDKLFAFSETDSLQNWLKKIRLKAKNGELSERYNFLLDPNLYTLKGENKTIYRVNLYALRRFSFTFHYWITFNQDAVTLSKTFGHSRVDTTLQYYIFPPESIGLTRDMINKKISIDNFIKLLPAGQKYLDEFFPKRQVSIPKVPGQRRLDNYFEFFTTANK